VHDPTPAHHTTLSHPLPQCLKRLSADEHVCETLGAAPEATDLPARSV
jgi:hypothetical protein